MCFEMVSMPISDDELNRIKEAEKLKGERHMKQREEEKKKANPIETVTLDILQSKKSNQN